MITPQTSYEFKSFKVIDFNTEAEILTAILGSQL
jgi:hypothetical protein